MTENNFNDFLYKIKSHFTINLKYGFYVAYIKEHIKHHNMKDGIDTTAKDATIRKKHSSFESKSTLLQQTNTTFNKEQKVSFTLICVNIANKAISMV